MCAPRIATSGTHSIYFLTIVKKKKKKRCLWAKKKFSTVAQALRLFASLCIDLHTSVFCSQVAHSAAYLLTIACCWSLKLRQYKSWRRDFFSSDRYLPPTQPGGALQTCSSPWASPPLTRTWGSRRQKIPASVSVRRFITCANTSKSSFWAFAQQENILFHREPPSLSH